MKEEQQKIVFAENLRTIYLGFYGRVLTKSKKKKKRRKKTKKKEIETQKACDKNNNVTHTHTQKKTVYKYRNPPYHILADEWMIGKIEQNNINAAFVSFLCSTGNHLLVRLALR